MKPDNHHRNPLSGNKLVPRKSGDTGGIDVDSGVSRIKQNKKILIIPTEIVEARQ